MQCGITAEGGRLDEERQAFFLECLAQNRGDIHLHRAVQRAVGGLGDGNAREIHRRDVGRGDPACRPILRLEFAHDPAGGLAPVRDRSFFIPNADPPLIGLAGFQGLARVGDGNGSIGIDLAAVPCTGHFDVIGGLGRAGPGGFHFPAKARLHLVDAERVDSGFAAQVDDAGVRMRGSAEAKSEHS
jgi:hypothetical protein